MRSGKTKGKRINEPVLCPKCNRPLNIGFLKTGVHNPIKCGFTVTGDTLTEMQQLYLDVRHKMKVAIELFLIEVWYEKTGEIMSVGDIDERRKSRELRN